MTSTASPARKRVSTTLPDFRLFSFARTNARQLPGFTCWNSTTVHNSPSMRIVRPDRKSDVEAINLLRVENEAESKIVGEKKIRRRLLKVKEATVMSHDSQDRLQRSVRRPLHFVSDMSTMDL